MEPTIFRFIWKYSWRQQLLILALTALSFPVLYVTLELPKRIINEALAPGATGAVIFGFDLDQVAYLFALCGLFLALVLVSGLLKYVLNVYSGVVSERMLRRLRFQLYEHLLRFPLPYFRRVSPSELVQMINAEVEPLGGYVAAAIAVPAFQGGTLVTILAFMFMQDWILGLAAVALYPLQAYVIPKLQRRVNALGVRRVRQVRRNAEVIGETATGIVHVHADDTSLYEGARFSSELGKVFWIRFDIYKKKFLIKFINNFIAQLGPFFFFSIGGYLVLQGEITLGALVAVLNAHKDLSAPWKELLTYYQLMYDVKIKYEQVVAQFMPPGLKPRELLLADPPPDAPAFAESLAAHHVVYAEDEETLLDGASFTLELPAHVAILGAGGSGRVALAMLLAGLVSPKSGRVLVDGKVLHDLPESVLGRRIGFVPQTAHVFRGTLLDNLLYGLKHRPIRPRPADPELERELREARLSGNLPLDIGADWVDDSQAGLEAPTERLKAVLEALELVQMRDDVYHFGLRGTIREAERPELAKGILRARRRMLDRLASDAALARLVEPFDPERYNSNATVAENLLFGTPLDASFGLERLAEQPFIHEVLERTGLARELALVGCRLAAVMLELFRDLPPEHEYFRQFSFLDPEELPQFRALVQRVDPEHIEQADHGDRCRLLTLAFRLVPARHRLGLLTPELQERILEARRLIRRELPPQLRGSIAFFDPAHYNDALSLQENIVFGKLAYGQARVEERVAALIREILCELDLEAAIVEVGLDYECGVGGARLTFAQRQKVAIAREIVKRPQILILVDATAPLDEQEQSRVRDNIRAAFEGRSLFWVLGRQEWASLFDLVLVMERGRVAALGRFEQLGMARGGLEPLATTA